MRVTCRTNLDLSNEEWPDELPAVPRVGDYIQSATKHATKHGHFQLELQVCRVTWQSTRIGWVPEIELHMTQFQRGLPAKSPEAADGSITAFYEWYAPLVGREASAFI
jgi:hypothetical protein